VVGPPPAVELGPGPAQYSCAFLRLQPALSQLPLGSSRCSEVGSGE
jgi:hypothetical protein